MTNPQPHPQNLKTKHISNPASLNKHRLALNLSLTMLLTLSLLLSCYEAKAQIIASDPASNYTTGTWTNNSNLGTGFGEWYIAGSQGTGGFNGNIIDGGNSYSNYAPLRTDGVAYAIYAGNSGSAFQDAGRSFATPLVNGDVFSFSLGFAFDNGNKGFNLYSDNLTSQIFNFNINNSGYSWTGGSTGMTPWVGIRENGVVIDFLFTKTSNGFDYSFSSIQDVNLTQSGSITAGGFESFKFYISDAGGGEGGNLYFNDLQVVPEPSTYTLLGLTAIALLGYRHRMRTRLSREKR